jgi:hypothetical protein
VGVGFGINGACRIKLLIAIAFKGNYAGFFVIAYSQIDKQEFM